MLRRVKAPVIGFYGEDDEAVTEPSAATETMKRGQAVRGAPLPGATHAFLAIQFEGRNTPAVEHAWPRATAFLKEHLLSEEREAVMTTCRHRERGDRGAVADRSRRVASPRGNAAPVVRAEARSTLPRGHREGVAECHPPASRMDDRAGVSLRLDARLGHVSRAH